MQSSISRLISKFNDASVLCIGDLMFDNFVFGEVSRISPEAPIPVLKIISEQNALGGSGNVARNLSSLGVTCHFIGLVGDDERGRQLIDMANGLAHFKSHVIVDKNHTTITKSRYIAGNQQLLRVDNERIQALAPETEQQIIELILQTMPLVNVVILSDYAKGILSPAIIDVAITAAKKLKKQIIVDPKGTDFSKYRGADIITPNQKEFENATGETHDIVRAAEKLIKESGIENILVTRGPDGMSLISQNTTSALLATHIPTTAQEVFDVSGAGDTVVATLAAACAVGSDFITAATLANRAAGIVVGKVGTAVIRKEELEQAIHEETHCQLEAKIVPILSLERAVDLREIWRRKNFRVGFTNGCFDLLHSGHVTLLRQARAQCDRLIVGLNSDSSVKRLKGESRPIQDEHTRALVLSALADVDLVVLFEQDTPLELITQLAPDLLIKGSDYTVEQVVGADIVQKQGGRVLLIDLVPNQSTSGIVKRIEAAPV